MTFNAASRLRSFEDRSAALGSRRCELPGMHSVPKYAVLPYASGYGGLSRRLLITTIKIHASFGSTMGRTLVGLTIDLIQAGYVVHLWGWYGSVVRMPIMDLTYKETTLEGSVALMRNPFGTWDVPLDPL